MLKSKYFIKLLLSIIAIIVVVIPLSTYSIYGNYSKTLIDSTYTKYDEYLSEITKRTLVLNEWLNQISCTLYYSPYIYNMLISDNLEPVNEVRGRLSMRQVLSATPNLHSIYLYNGELDIFYSTTSVNKSWDDFFDKDLLDKMKHINTNDFSTILVRKIDFTLNNTRTRTNVLTIIIPRRNNSNIRDNNMIVVNFNADMLNDLLSPEISDTEEFYMLNREGKVMFEGNGEKFLQDMSDTNWMKEIKNKGLKSGHFIYEEEDESYLACYTYLEQLEGYMIYIAPRETLFKKTEDLRLWTMILTILLIVIMIGVAILVAKLLYKPMDILVHMFGDDNEEEIEDKPYLSDEFKLIESKINKMSKDNQNMIQHQQLQQNALAHYFMRDLLTIHPSDPEKITDKFKENNILLDPHYIIPVCIQLDTNSRNCDELSMLRLALSNMAQDVAKVPILLFDMEDDTIALLYNYNDNQGNWLYSFTKLLKESFTLLFKCSFTTSVGNVCKYPQELHAAWQKTMILAEYRLLIGCGSFITEEDIVKHVKAEVQYPIKKERYIIDALNLGHKQDAAKAISIMFNYISTQSVDNAKLSMRRLLSTLIREFSRILSSRHYQQENSCNLFQQLKEFYSINDMREWMINMCFDVIDETSPDTNDIKQDHVNNAIKIIQEEYNNPNLSSNMIASRLGLSSSYMREIFSQYTNNSLPKYINNYRCEIGKEMLMKTKLPISVISEKIGVANTKYFYSLFKKSTGMTPSDYRDSHK